MSKDSRVVTVLGWAAGVLSLGATVACLSFGTFLLAEIADIRQELDLGMADFRSQSGDLWRDMIGMGASPRLRRQVGNYYYEATNTRPATSPDSYEQQRPAVAPTANYGPNPGFPGPSRPGFPGNPIPPGPQKPGFPSTGPNGGTPGRFPSPGPLINPGGGSPSARPPPPGGPLPPPALPGCQCDLNRKCPPGPPGGKGDNGFEGVEGEPGTDGDDGTDAEDVQALRQQMGCTYCPNGPPGDGGSNGRSGPRGMRGSGGQSGSSGRDGRPGAPGNRGDVGPSGPDGNPGPVGGLGRDANNVIGRPGERGPSGKIGDAGVPGSDGRPATDGQRGNLGEQGQIGLAGNAGRPGVTGPPGYEGTAGKDASYCKCPDPSVVRPVAPTSGYDNVREAAPPPYAYNQDAWRSAEQPGFPSNGPPNEYYNAKAKKAKV